MIRNILVNSIENDKISIISVDDKPLNIVSVNKPEITIVSAGSGLQGIPGLSALGEAEGPLSWKEPASVFNNGNPELIFTDTGDVVMTNAS